MRDRSGPLRSSTPGAAFTAAAPGGPLTVLRSSPAGSSQAPVASSGFGLTRNLLEKARRRVRAVSLLFVGGALFSLAVRTARAVLRPDEPGEPLIGIGYAATVALVSGAYSLFAGRQDVRPVTILKVGLGFEVFICFVVQFGHLFEVWTQHGHPPFLTWATPIIILFPLLLPSPPRVTLLAAAASGSSAPLALALLAAVTGTPTLPGDYLWISVSPIIAISVAYFGSGVIYEFNVAVARAERMGSYELEKLLDRGGMGEVWTARHQMLARPAAIKLMRPELFGEEGLARFEREAQTTAMMRSPHTIQLYDFGVAEDGRFYYVMELLDGFDLETLVKRFGPVPPERTVFFLTQVCASLTEAHESGFIHGDVKPANVYTCRYALQIDFIKVLDFGLARTRAAPLLESGTSPVPRTIQGTPAYLAPELVHGDVVADVASDLYAVGCVGYWLLTGRTVFEESSLPAMLHQQVAGVPRPPSELSEAAIPDELERILLECLEKNPAKRPETASTLAARLGAVPLETPWTPERALRWWDLHRPPSPGSAAGRPVGMPTPA